MGNLSQFVCRPDAVEKLLQEIPGVRLAGQVGPSHPGAYSNGSPLMDESLPTGYSPNRESHHGECW